MEHADELNAVSLPIPTEQRVDVFVATLDVRLETAWTRYGGTSTFHYPGGGMQTDFAAFCGVAIFRLDNPHQIPAEVFERLRPFFDRAGSEANVFEFCPIRKMFTRRDLAWFDGRII